MAKRRYEEVDEFQEDTEDAEENAEEDAELEPEQNAAEDGEAGTFDQRCPHVRENVQRNA